MLGDMFRKVFGQKETGKGAQLVQRMGGNVARLSQEERQRLEKATGQIPVGDDVNALLNHVAEHGSAMIGDQMALLNKAGAFDATHAKMDAREAAYKALWATDAPLPTEEQLQLLEKLPSGSLRQFLSSQCRTGLVFEPDLRTATPQDLTFAGGLPVVSGALNWPMKKGAGGADVPCHFLGQIDCSRLPEFALRYFFPEKGALVFFLADGACSAPLVQHCDLDHPQEVQPPKGLETGDSRYDTTLDGEIKTGWPHEEGLSQARSTIFPKFPLMPRLDCQAPRHSWFFEQKVEVPENLLEPFDGCKWSFLEDQFEALNKAGGSAVPDRDNGQFTPRGFDGFPHIWGNVARLLEKVDLLIQSTETFYEERIQANSNTLPSPKMSAKWLPENPQDQAAEVARTKELLNQLLAARALVTDWIERAHAKGRGTLVSEEERGAFWHLWDNHLADTDNFALEARWNPGTPLNAAYKMADLIRKEATQGAIASLSYDQNTLPPEARDWMPAYLRSLHGERQYPHIQSLGHATAQDSEAPFLDLLLMQFPGSGLFDWYFGDCGSVQFWLSQHDFQIGDFSKATLVRN